MKSPVFNPHELKERLLGDFGYEWSLEDRFDEVKRIGGLASTADADLAVAIQCLLVGFDDAAERLLHKAVKWVQAAIAENERPQRYFPNGTEASRFHTLALCNWLLHAEHDTESFREFMSYEDSYLASSMAGKDKLSVSFVLPGYVNAGAFDRALEIFERTRGLSAPKTLGALRSEGAMAYVISRHRLGLQYSEHEVAAATARFLTRNMDDWLGRGHWVTAAEWTKIVYWNGNEESLSPKQALMRCYDHLPHWDPPA